MRITLMSVAVMLGCQATKIETDKPPPRPPHELAVRFHMYRNLDMARAIERLLVRGNLDDAKALARTMADAPDPLGLDTWAKHMTRVRDQAAALANAPGIDEACRRAARLSAACAGCHVESGAMPIFEQLPAVPPDRPTVADRMLRHTWAINRIWEGTISGADPPWRAGLEVLAETPLPFSIGAGDRAALAKELQRLASQAQSTVTTDTADERARRYGEMLVICAACHSGRSTTPRSDATAE